MILIDGRKIRDTILTKLEERIRALPAQPGFCDVLVGTDPVSEQYVRMKNATAEKIGIKAHPAVFPASITTEELVTEVQKIAALPNMAGLIIQLPLPEHIDRQRVLDAVPSSIDVDVTGTENSTRFYTGEPNFVFPTAAAVVAVLAATGVRLVGSKIVVVGQGMLVGKPVTHLLQKARYDVSTVDSATKNPDEWLETADVIISATGQPNSIMGDQLKQHVVVIDAGASEVGGGVVGDVDVESLEDRASFVSPVPGGVGPVTVAMLMQNIVEAAEKMKTK